MSPAVIGLAPAASHPTLATPAAVVRKANPAPYGWQTHVVRPGDTLSDLALRHRTTIGALVHRNHLRGSAQVLMVGTRLSVPRTTPAPKAARTSRTAGYSTYAVRPGDTISGIAARLRVSQSTVLRLNGLHLTSRIFPGQKLKVSARAAAKRPVATTATRRVVVRPGDTVSAIAARFGVSQASVLKANHLSARTMIRSGRVLLVPVKASHASTQARNTFAGRTYADAVVRAASANRRYLARHAVPSRDRTRAMIVQTARRHGVDPRLALAIGWQESGWSQRQVSVANAIGTMQVIPSAGQWASQLVGRHLNLLNTQDNITAGVVILRALHRSAKNEQQAIAGYYQGLASVQRSGMFADTKAYVRAIEAHRSRM